MSFTMMLAAYLFSPCKQAEGIYLFGMSKHPKPSIQSMGGNARAVKLSAEQRSAIARSAAEAKWGMQKATHEGTIKIGETIEIPCAVLEDGTRVLTQTGMQIVLGRHKNASGGELNVNKPKFLAASNLSQFIPSDLEKSWEPIRFRISGTTGNNSIGYRAEILPMVCHVYEDAERAGRLLKSQQHIADKARVLSRSFSKLGIIALVDEATGYQYDRARDALARILEQFIAKELRAWTRTFPVEFYEEIFRLKGWKFDPATMQGPRCLAQMTDDVVYNRLAPGIRAELRRKNPVVDGRRKAKHHQWLTGEVGHPRLLAHLEGVKVLMLMHKTYDEFHEKLDKVYPIKETTELGMEVALSKKPNTLVLLPNGDRPPRADTLSQPHLL